MRFLFTLGLTLAACLASTVSAQQPAAQQPRAQQPQPVQSVSPFPSPLYRMNDVSKHLNLNDKQLQQLNTLTEKTQAAYQERMNRLGTLAQLERGPRVQELNCGRRSLSNSTGTRSDRRVHCVPSKGQRGSA
jgi:hypothetical protein